jgi:hypothetical protein
MEDIKNHIMSALMAEASARQDALGQNPAESGWGSPSRTHGVGVKDPNDQWVKSLTQVSAMVTDAVAAEVCPDYAGLDASSVQVFLLTLPESYRVFPARMPLHEVPERYFMEGKVQVQILQNGANRPRKPVVLDALPQEFISSQVTVKIHRESGMFKMWIAGRDENLFADEGCLVIYRYNPKPQQQIAQQHAPRPAFKKYGFGAALQSLGMEDAPPQSHAQPGQKKRYIPNAKRARK